MSIDSDVRYAGFWRRLAAGLIDTVLFGLLSVILLTLLYGADHFSQALEQGPASYHGIGDFFIENVLPILLVTWCWVKYRGTPGKLLLECKVVDAKTGEGLTVGKAVLRYFGYYISLIPIGLGFLWIAWDRRKQGFHDKIAGSVVIITSDREDSLDEMMKELP